MVMGYQASWRGPRTDTTCLCAEGKWTTFAQLSAPQSLATLRFVRRIYDEVCLTPSPPASQGSVATSEPSTARTSELAPDTHLRCIIHPMRTFVGLIAIALCLASLSVYRIREALLQSQQEQTLATIERITIQNEELQKALTIASSSGQQTKIIEDLKTQSAALTAQAEILRARLPKSDSSPFASHGIEAMPSIPLTPEQKQVAVQLDDLLQRHAKLLAETRSAETGVSESVKSLLALVMACNKMNTCPTCTVCGIAGVPMRLFVVQLIVSLAIIGFAVWLLTRQVTGVSKSKYREFSFAAITLVVGYWLKG
jgi:hypothetical protein